MWTMTSLVEHVNSSVKTYSYNEEFPMLMPKWGYALSAFVLFLIGFFGFFLNLMVMLLMFKDRQLWTPLNIILFNLVCSDFSVSVLGNPFTLTSALFHRWIFGQTMCVIYGFFMALLGITSITTLTVLSFERYLIVTRPLSSRHLSPRGALLSVGFIWTYSLALTTPPLMGWGNYVSEAANISCSVNWHEQSMNTLTYILFLFAMGQIVPMGVISFSYYNIVRTMKQNSQRLGRVNRAEAKVTGMVFVMIIAFTVAWTPYSIFALMEQFATERIISPGVGVIPALVAKSSICYDPIIYVGMNSQFRQSIKRIFGIHNKGRYSPTEKAFENTLMSPTHKVCFVNDFTLRNISETTLSSMIRKNKNDENIDTADVTKNDKNQAKEIELCAIEENMMSDVNISQETYEFENSNTNSSRKLDRNNSSHCIKVDSPVLTIIDNDDLALNKYSQTDDENVNSVPVNAYGNKFYDFHSIDVADVTNSEKKDKIAKSVIKHSFSLDLGSNTKESTKRKLSIEPKHDTFIQITGIFRNQVASKIFDQDCKEGQDRVKSYLFRIAGKDSNEDDSL